MSSTWIFDPRYGYYEVRFGGTSKVLQSYFAVTKIVILLCMQNLFQYGSDFDILFSDSAVILRIRKCYSRNKNC